MTTSDTTCACRFEWRDTSAVGFDFSGKPPAQTEECAFHASQRKEHEGKLAAAQAEIAALREALASIVVVRDGQAYFRTANGIPMEMNKAKSKLVCAAIDAARKG